MVATFRKLGTRSSTGSGEPAGNWGAFPTGIGTDIAEDQGNLHGPPQTRLVMPFNGVVFPAEGTYAFELVIGGERQRLAPLHLIRDPGAN